MGGAAVIDLETTGIHPGYHHRIVELGVVLLDEDLRFEGTWTTLVNPQRDLGESSDIHGLRAGDLLDAPTFADIAPDLLHVLHGRYLVAHNARFDLGFLAYELHRSGLTVDGLDAVCTLRVASSCGLPTRLADLAAALAIEHQRAHEALADAEATAAVFTGLYRTGRLHWASTVPPAFLAPAAPPPCRRCVPRTQRAPARGDRFIAALAARLSYLPTAAVDAPIGAVVAYADVLDRALEDRVLTDAEIDELVALSATWGLSGLDLTDIHRSYLTSLIAVALSDRVLTDVELDDLRRVAELLAIDSDVLSRLIAAAGAAARHRGRPTGVITAAPSSGGADAGVDHELRGKSVCFTGACRCQHNGQAITRERAELLAAAAGMIVAPRVTKALDVLVVADPDSMSGKATKAKTYGTRVIAERVFWETLGVAVS